MGVLTFVAWLRNLIVGSAVYLGIAAIGFGAFKAWDYADDKKAITKHETEKTEHVQRKITKAKRAGNRVRTDDDVRRVLERAARSRGQ